LREKERREEREERGEEREERGEEREERGENYIKVDGGELELSP
jgi:hypothetical protein